MSLQSVSFIGGGAMATALAKGFLTSGVVQTVNIADPYSIDKLRQTLGHPDRVFLSTDNAEVCRRSKIIILAVKPQIIDVVLPPLRNVLSADQLLISICAGCSISKLKSMTSARVVRVMPNTPALVQAMAAGYSPSSEATPEDMAVVEKLLSSLGVVQKVPEKLMDAVTGLSGSGPAYVFMFIEALADGGVQAGLPRKTALQLAIQTVIGSAKLMQETGDHPGVLKDRVASPGGTTINGIAALEEGGFRSAVIKAVKRAADRSKELSKL